MHEMDQLAHDIETSVYQMRPKEIMRWGHEDLLGGLRRAASELNESVTFHSQVSFDSFLKHGPLHDRVKHIRSDFVITDASRFPVAFIDFLGAGHDTTHAAVKAALACKTGLAFLQVPAEWSFSELKQALAAVLNTRSKEIAVPVHGALALQEMLNQQNFGAARAA